MNKLGEGLGCAAIILAFGIVCGMVLSLGTIDLSCAPDNDVEQAAQFNRVNARVEATIRRLERVEARVYRVECAQLDMTAERHAVVRTVQTVYEKIEKDAKAKGTQR